MRVMTVLSPIEPTEMGVTLPHEHVIVDLCASLGGFDAVFDDVDLTVKLVMSSGV